MAVRAKLPGRRIIAAHILVLFLVGTAILVADASTLRSTNVACGAKCLEKLEKVLSNGAGLSAGARAAATASLRNARQGKAVKPQSQVDLMLLEVANHADVLKQLQSMVGDATAANNGMAIAEEDEAPTSKKTMDDTSLTDINDLLDTAGEFVSDIYTKDGHKQSAEGLATSIDQAILSVPELTDAAQGLSPTNGADGHNPNEPGLGQSPNRLAYGAVRTENALGSAFSVVEMLEKESKYMINVVKAFKARVRWDDMTCKKIYRTASMMLRYQGNLERAERAQRSVLSKTKSYVVGLEKGVTFSELLLKHMKHTRNYVVAIHEQLKASDSDDPDPKKSDEEKKKSLSESASVAVAALGSLERLSQDVETGAFRHNMNIMGVYKKLLGIAKMMGKIHDAYEDVQYDHMFKDNLETQNKANQETQRLNALIKTSLEGAKEGLDEDLSKMFKMMHSSITNTKVAEMQSMKKKVAAKMADMLKLQIERREHGLWLVGNTARAEAREQYNNMEKMLAFKKEMEKKQTEEQRMNNTLADSVGLQIKFQQALHKAVDDAAEKGAVPSSSSSTDAAVADLTERLGAKVKNHIPHREMTCSCDRPKDRDLELDDFQGGQGVRCTCKPAMLE